MHDRKSKMGRNIAIGLVLGVVFGIAMDNDGLGIALGLPIGAATGLAQSKRDDSDQK
jgi:hypothetical protein